MNSMARGFTRPDGREPELIRLDRVAAVHPGERLGHLAAVAVLDADEQHSLLAFRS